LVKQKQLEQLIPEEWKVIENAPNYAISNWGRVKSLITNHILKSGFSPYTGYYNIPLRRDTGEMKTHRIHLLVAHHFIEKPQSDEFLVVDHIDRDRTNNISTNLRYLSRSDNQKNRTKTAGTISKYMNVSFNKTKNKWGSQFQYKDKTIYVGYFETEDDAARAYNKKVLEIVGDVARLNIID
jgi:hypothetical protein